MKKTIVLLFACSIVLGVIGSALAHQQPSKMPVEATFYVLLQPPTAEEVELIRSYRGQLELDPRNTRLLATDKYGFQYFLTLIEEDGEDLICLGINISDEYAAGACDSPLMVNELGISSKVTFHERTFLAIVIPDEYSDSHFSSKHQNQVLLREKNILVMSAADDREEIVTFTSPKQKDLTIHN